MEMIRGNNAIKQKTIQLLSALILIPAFLNAQCPTEAQLEGGGTLTIPTDGDCSSPVTCSINPGGGGFLDIDGNFTLLSCATLDLTQNSSFITIVGGTFTIEEGATLTANRRFIVDIGTLIVNGTLDVGDGNNTDNLVIGFGGSIIVGSTGTIDVGNGSVRVGGNNGGNTGTLTVNGTLTTTGDVLIRNNGTIDGTGTITYGGTYTNNGTTGGEFTNCTGGSSATSCGSSTLPVELASFSSSLENDVAQLKWETASELNNEGFFIEKSINGLDFEEIGFIEGNGTTSEWNTYEFTDPLITDNSYYRLRQVDYDGQFEYSPISFLEFDRIAAQIKMDIYPNPVVSGFHFTNAIDGIFDWSVISFSGQRVLYSTNMTAAQAEVQINELLPKLGDGIYVIHLSNSDTQKTVRMVKR